MAESDLARRHRLSRQHLRADQASRRRQNQLTDASFRKRVEIKRLSASIDRSTRDVSVREHSPEVRPEYRSTLLDQLGTAKAEALRRIAALPWFALHKDDWYRDVERVTPTAVDAPQALAEIVSAMKQCRAERYSSWAQQMQLSPALFLTEIQLDWLIKLSRDWQSA